MARKKKHADHANHERWLVSYADFITLLFAFFVVLFAASNSDEKKAGKVAQAVQTAFRDMAIFDPQGRVVPLYDERGLPSNATTVIGNAHTPFGVTQFAEGSAGSGRDSPPIKEVRTSLETLLKEEIAAQSVRLSEDSRGLTITLAEAGFFEPGSAVMPARALAVIDRIAATLRPLSYGIRVEGHTDNTPIHTAQFPSNWELSTARATSLLQYLITTSQIPAPRLSAVGYGEYRPAASNTTPEGRAANRRVDLVVLGDAAQKLEPQLR
jgi:chemotaxis protein MotB